LQTTEFAHVFGADFPKKRPNRLNSLFSSLLAGICRAIEPQKIWPSD
jgi:hypothetical protein